MKVLALLPPPNWGGLHAHLGATARAFASAGWGEIVPCLPIGAEFDAIEARFATLGLRCERAAMGRMRFNKILTNLGYLVRLRGEAQAIARVARNGGYDLIQTPGAHHFHGIFAARKARLPLVWQLHSDLAPAAMRRIAAWLIQRFASAVMINGRTVARRFPKIERGHLKPIYFGPVISPDGLQVSPDARANVRSDLGIPLDALVIGTVGVRSRQKAHERLINAVDAMSGAFLILVGKAEAGSKSYYDSVVLGSSAAHRLKEEGRLVVINPGQPIAHYLAAFDIFSMSSVAEGMPIALAEAMYMGLPAVCSAVGGIGEMIEDGITGFATPPNDSKALSAALRQLCDDSAMRCRMGNAARERAVAFYRPESAAQAHLDAYREAGGRGGLEKLDSVISGFSA